MKNKVSAGTRGVATNVPEYQLNLEVALKLKERLLEEGYEVVMIRETHDVNISNAERAKLASEAGADMLIRIHANGSENKKVNGVMTLCMTPKSPYCPQLYEDSRRLSDMILNAVVEHTGAKKQSVWETDTMSGINWCEIPVTIIEMGYMSNPEEDRRMQTPEYQEKIVEGMVEGIRKYFE